MQALSAHFTQMFAILFLFSIFRDFVARQSYQNDFGCGVSIRMFFVSEWPDLMEILKAFRGLKIGKIILKIRIQTFLSPLKIFLNFLQNWSLEGKNQPNFVHPILFLHNRRYVKPQSIKTGNAGGMDTLDQRHFQQGSRPLKTSAIWRGDCTKVSRTPQIKVA